MKLYFKLESADEKVRWILHNILDEDVLTGDSISKVKRIQFYLDEAFSEGISLGLDRAGELKNIIKHIKNK